jgi:hypothetical protein
VHQLLLPQQQTWLRPVPAHHQLQTRALLSQVSTPGLQAAHHYIWGLTQQLQAAAQQRGDVIVQTAFENYTGSADFDFVVRVHTPPGPSSSSCLHASNNCLADHATRASRRCTVVGSKLFVDGAPQQPHSVVTASAQPTALALPSCAGPWALLLPMHAG